MLISREARKVDAAIMSQGVLWVNFIICNETYLTYRGDTELYSVQATKSVVHSFAHAQHFDLGTFGEILFLTCKYPWTAINCSSELNVSYTS